MRFVFIDPDFEKILTIDYEDDVAEAVLGLRSKLWGHGGWSAEKRTRECDSWAVYGENEKKGLDYLGQVKDYD